MSCEAGDNSGRDLIVAAQQATEEPLAADATDVMLLSETEFLRRSRCRRGQRSIPKPLVWAMLVEKANVLPADVAEMARAETQKIIQALAFDRANPCLRERVRIWS